MSGGQLLLKCRTREVYKPVFLYLRSGQWTILLGQGES